MRQRLDDFIVAGKAGLDAAAKAIDFAKGAGNSAFSFDAAQVKLHAPWLLLADSNGSRSFYAAHIAGISQNHLQQNLNGCGVKTAAVRSQSGSSASGKWFRKFTTQATTTSLSSRTIYLDYEGEAAIIIGKRGSDIKADQIEDYVWGVTLYNIRTVPSS